ncbi:bifunctional (p)ppGpp synthetase/guanosine-3',5'-bis(diphosphate) 3'-pyrophosphohydrolase [Alloacidobacterium dinghuense]|uniref:Bifunctional (P)ppGpp synthetase/guanosine-3',5'-bis(Diphosphate) 3'-pyrophosphohydrolase n=1 Tax=Alloacidobacterium dinghuense TaxID=2763107 RepID=A0A7G8BH87_9BACT|nr:bifunctional (p)ppGpp synthetase/guanosine-3',5'-bis(diphosphate) 3'-pyrophosphohydrolase [Alloacidobacterium dinghuense]QNI31907.1 bifunctional (p)ppGpp synthetase/guanosine-3',5'-bis(diphosphate) 3'-pyrophosphohydrolase [Alloacidobacterium dinghuense]
MATAQSASVQPAKPVPVVDPFAPRVEKLIATVRANRPSDDTEIIRKAWEFCLEHHKGQLRASGEPYVLHPLEVALVLAEMKLDSTAIAAGLLHDAVEDTPVTTADITAKFGEQVAHIVEGVTKIDKIQFANKEDRQAENVRKMLLAMVSDVRVVLIKLADRLHNMRTLEHLPPDKQQGIARETLDIYAPLAHRLGMGKVRGELEDLAFRFVDPYAYQQVHDAVEERRSEGEQFLAGVDALLQEKLREHNIKARVEWRIKRLYSVNQKLIKARTTVDQVYDLLALRVITTSVQDCYAVFGLIHSIWRPVPGRIKDFIAMPRPNLYQSLHTTVMGEGGHQFEVQIRTEEMHRIAEEGIAAHWKYKASGSPISARDEQRLAWVRQLVEWQREMSDPNEFLSTLKIDLYPEEVYTFTPKGKVVVLPKDASPLDFAYAIHTEVGHSCIGAKVNGRMAPLRSKLRNGDIVEVVTQNGHTPSRDWLTFVKSSRARNKIKHWLNEHQRERAIEIGRKLLEREARKYKISLSKFEDSDYERIAAEYSVATPNDLLAAVGFGKYSARQVLNRLAPGVTSQQTAETDAAVSGVADAVKRVSMASGADSLQVEGQNELLVYRARCCNPIRGEEIIGYVTRGKGVAVHARSCPNVQNLLYESDRRISVEWARPTEDTPGRTQTYPVKLTVYCDDRAGMLKEMTAVISDDNTNIRSVDSKPGTNNDATVEFIVDAEDVRHLNRLVQGLRRVPGVRDVQRSQKL